MMKPIFPALALAGLLLLPGCGAAESSPPAATAGEAAAEVVDEAIALQAVGYDTGLAGAPGATSGAGDAPHRGALRRQLRANTLHGEVAVQTKAGPKTIVVQRGEVIAVSGDGLTVKSSDGVSLGWTFDDRLRIVQDRKPVEKSAVKAGARIGVAGVKDGDAARARLIIIK
jgi:hypothetical protein